MKTCKLLLLALCCGCVSASAAGKAGSEAPRIVNIVNFIRNIEPRSEEITETVLYETVARQAAQLAEYGLPATFLLQYDALINPRYRKLLTQDVYPGTEVGGWWEITQPHVEAAGLKWRGRYPWDWHADVGFASGGTHPKNAANWWTSTWKNSKRYSANTRRHRVMVHRRLYARVHVRQIRHRRFVQLQKTR